jgi:radical SAM protein (TIGR01212 family)
MAYVQAFTGTHAPPDTQRDLFGRILDLHPFVAISIGTRPDCLPDGTLQVLQALRERLDVWVELGIQTVHNATLTRIHRGHSWETSRLAVERLAARGIRTVAHVILGLPGEDRGHYRETARRLAALPLDGIKVHNLHVVHGSDLAAEYEQCPFPLLNETDYADVLIEFLRLTPPNVAVMRINTDTPPDRLVAPVWRMAKGRFRQHVIDTMTRRGVRQGDLSQAPA